VERNPVAEARELEGFVRRVNGMKLSDAEPGDEAGASETWERPPRNAR